MERQVRTIDGGATLAEALASHFGEGQQHRAYPAVDDGALLGIISRSDLIKPSSALFDEEQRREKFRTSPVDAIGKHMAFPSKNAGGGRRQLTRE